jgi:type II secretory ATPase GspE/PulE/Tfp pilus assembly ATPase PilB-like protein
MNRLYYSLLSALMGRCGPVVSLEEYALLGIEGIAQTEASKEEGATWPELVTVALRQEPGLFACFPVKERATMEMILLAAAHTRVLAVMHQPDAASALRWLLRNQFRSPLRAGILKGILTVVSIPTLCPRCKLPVEVPGRSGRTYGLQTRQGCEECLSWESLPTEEILEWLPMGPPAIGRIGQEGELGDLHHAVLEQGGVPLGHRVLLRAQEGILDAQEAQEYLP